MKKFIIILLVAVIASSAVFAADFSIGIMQNYMHTMVMADLGGDHFGVEGAVGIPLVSGIAGTIDYISRGGINPDTGEKEPYNIAEMFLLPAGVLNGYFKIVNTKHFEWRIGLQGDAISLMDKDHFTFIALAGISTGLDFKFNSGFSINLSGAFPIAALLPEEAAKYTIFYYTTKTEDNWDFLMILPLVINEFARLSFKWSI
ncbi:MAG: hypothetical protein J6X41_05515 [Spirochaetales bacterium]|nr:hypothetical protein [Spirochaetales bacterium]